LTPLPVPKAPLRRHGDGYDLAGLGIDRLAAIEGCLAALSPAHGAAQLAAAGAPPANAGLPVPSTFALVVAAGTATTIDAVRIDGAHLGGLILPGVATALASLHQAASLLPAIDPVASPVSPAADALGHDTRSAMQQATLTMTCGAIERVARRVADRHRLTLAGVWVTGGWGEAVAAGVGGSYVRDLVMSGGRELILGGTL
jgi:pantothenate kinase type III